MQQTFYFVFNNASAKGVVHPNITINNNKQSSYVFV